MKPYRILEIGSKYSKNELSVLLDQPALKYVREGVFACTNSKSYLLFVDLEKTGKVTRFHFNDFFEEEYFHWDSQTTQHIDSPKIQDLVKDRLTPHLFVRLKQKDRSKTLPFVYCGRLSFETYEAKTERPVHIIFQSVDFDDFTENLDLLEIYNWKPSKAGKTSKSNITKRGSVSVSRKKKYQKPNKTERKGLVSSRVGQGYYRQQIIEKWDGKCAILKTDILTILIASHIVRWSDCDDGERLDVENGILLSPTYDALFDKHFISFDDDGNILVSSSISEKDKELLGLTGDIKISVTEGMLPYLSRHRQNLI